MHACAPSLPLPVPHSVQEDGKYPTAKALKQIDLDLDRTFYDHKNLMEKDGRGQQVIFTWA